MELAPRLKPTADLRIKPHQVVVGAQLNLPLVLLRKARVDLKGLPSTIISIYQSEDIWLAFVR